MDVFYKIPCGHRQYVERITANVFEMKFKNEHPQNVHDFILESKYIEAPKDCSLDEGAWRNLSERSKRNGRSSHKQPLYAINILDTLFDANEPWNFKNFGNAHSIIHGLKPDQQEFMDGIQRPYVNIGMLYTWFCMHCEDSDLASVNYLHSGAPKYWLCVARSEGQKLKKVFMDLLSSNYKYKCETVYRHKCFIIDENFLSKHQIKYTKLVQNAGEFVFTLYGAYHWGWNGGFNVCESMNLASPKFRKIYAEAVLCKSSCEYSPMPLLVHEKLGELLKRADEMKIE